MVNLDPMQPKQPGRKANHVPSGFEIVPEGKLDFEFFKSRAEFSEEHGGNGGIYGRAEDIIRTDTPGNQSEYGSDSSRPGTPTRAVPGRAFPTTGPYANQPAASYDGQGDIGDSGFGYGHRSDSQTNLVYAASAMPMAAPPGYHGRSRETSQDRAPGFLGGGPQGYGGLPQAEEDHDHDPMNYDYYRGARR